MDAIIVGRVVAGVGGTFINTPGMSKGAKITQDRESILGTSCCHHFHLIELIISQNDELHYHPGHASRGTTLHRTDSRLLGRWHSPWSRHRRRLWNELRDVALSFYVNLVPATLLGPLFFLIFPRSNPQPDITLVSKLATMDWLGIVLNVAVWSLFLTVLALPGGQLPWDSASTIALWVVFGVCVIVFAFQQWFSKLTTPERRVLPLHLLANRTVILAGLGTGASATAAFVTIYYIPLFFQFTRGDSALDAATRLLPFIIPDVFVILVRGFTFPFIGFYAPLYLVSGILVVLAGGLFVGLLTATAASGAIYGMEVALGLGAGFTSQMAYTVCPHKVKPQDIPAVIGLLNIAQVGTAAVCLAISGAIWNNVGFHKLQDVLPPNDFTSAEIRENLAGTDSSILSHAPHEVQMRALNAIVSTISDVFALVIGAGVPGILCAVLMKWERLQFKT